MDDIASWVWVLIPLAAIGIPIVAILASVAHKWIAMKERQLASQTSLTAEKAAQYAVHTERLEERVRVLERIATDRGVDLSDEIEALRERPLN